MSALEKPAIDVHAPPRAGESDVLASLASGRLDPKFLYVTPRQAELWRQVFLRHSPIQGNLEFVRIYREAFVRVAEKLPSGKIRLVGLGCGTGAKELELYSTLGGNRSVAFSAIDVSRDLVAESAEKLARSGAESGGNLVCDLTQTDFLRVWLGKTDLPRLITFFGLVPNLLPSDVGTILRAVLRPGDVLLASAHLAPVRNEESSELAAAMNSILPQYDNVETLAWISAVLEETGLADHVERPRMEIGQVEGMPAFVAQAGWKTESPFEVKGHRFTPRLDRPLQLFYSIRYTPALFEDMLRREGCKFERLALTACREEGIWAVQA